jgi:hypothetical protein
MISITLARVSEFDGKEDEDIRLFGTPIVTSGHPKQNKSREMFFQDEFIRVHGIVLRVECPPRSR